MVNNFKAMRKKANLTQGQVAEAIGVDTSMVCKWETGTIIPRIDRLYQMATLYKCRVSDLIPDGPNESEAAGE